MKYSNINDTVQETSIKKYKATAGKIDRTAILASDKKFIIKTHFIDGVGNVHCYNDGTKNTLCCKMGRNPNIRNVYPLVKYPSDEEGNLIPGSIDLQALVISNTKDKSIKLKNKVLEKDGKKLSDIDLLMTGGEEQQLDGGGKYVDFDIDNGGEVSWKKNKAWVDLLKEKWTFYDENIEASMGKIVKDDAELLELLQIAKAKKSGGSLPLKQNNQNTNVAPEQKQLPASTTATVIESNVNEDDFFMNLEKTVTTEQKAEVVNESSSDGFDIFK